jgi:hypothetical protein
MSDQDYRVNQGGADGFTIDVSVWEHRQKRYLAHGVHGSLWTNDIAEVSAFISAELAAIEAAKRRDQEG